jgi:hypothetical protein
MDLDAFAPPGRTSINKCHVFTLQDEQFELRIFLSIPYCDALAIAQAPR